jgi:hypothetical protein
MLINDIVRSWRGHIPPRIEWEDSATAPREAARRAAPSYAAVLSTSLPHPNERTEITIVVRPDRSPDIGTICGLGLALVLAQRLKTNGGDVGVVCEVWGCRQAKEQGDDETQRGFLAEYEEVLQGLSTRYGIVHIVRTEEELLSGEEASGFMQGFIWERNTLTKQVPAETTSAIWIRAGCPVCGAVSEEDHSKSASGGFSYVWFSCVTHGQFEHKVHDSSRFQLSPQLLHLLRGRVYQRAKRNWIEICAGDGTAFWEEHALCRAANVAPVMVYTPPIHGFSSGLEPLLKMKSSCFGWGWRRKRETKEMKETKIDDDGLGYLPNYRSYKTEGKDLVTVWEEIERWADSLSRGSEGQAGEYQLF